MPHAVESSCDGGDWGEEGICHPNGKDGILLSHGLACSNAVVLRSAEVAAYGKLSPATYESHQCNADEHGYWYIAVGDRACGDTDGHGECYGPYNNPYGKTKKHLKVLALCRSLRFTNDVVELMQGLNVQCDRMAVTGTHWDFTPDIYYSDSDNRQVMRNILNNKYDLYIVSESTALRLGSELQKVLTKNVASVGTPAVTSRGLGAEDMKTIARLFGLVAKDYENSADKVRATVAEICKKYPLY